MDFAGIVDIALPVVYVLVGAVLVWFVVELALTIRSTRSTIDDAHKELTPTLQNVEKITAQVDPLIAHVDALVTDQIDPLLTRVNEIAEEAKPAVGRVDPLVERRRFTVDAANLESHARRPDSGRRDPDHRFRLEGRRCRGYRDERPDRFGELAHGQAAQQVQAALRLRRVRELGSRCRRQRRREGRPRARARGDRRRRRLGHGGRRPRRRRRGQRPPRRCQGRQRGQPRTCPRLRRPALRYRRARSPMRPWPTPTPTPTRRPRRPLPIPQPQPRRAILPNAAAAQAKPAPVGNSPYTVQ